MVDLPVMVRCGLPVAVPDAHWFTLQHAAYITKQAGSAQAQCAKCATRDYARERYAGRGFERVHQMKVRWRYGIAFPLVLAVALGGLSAWLGRINEIDIGRSQTQPQPAAIRWTQIDGRRFDEQGSS